MYKKIKILPEGGTYKLIVEIEKYPPYITGKIYKTKAQYYFNKIMLPLSSSMNDKNEIIVIIPKDTPPHSYIGIDIINGPNSRISVSNNSKPKRQHFTLHSLLPAIR